MPEPVVDDASLPSFSLKAGTEENSFGWGPSTVPPQFEGIPFAPFNRNDRLGRISDFSVSTKGGNTANRGRTFQQFGSGTGSFSYKHEDDESTFREVDGRPKPKRGFGNRGRAQNRPQWQNNRGQNRGGYNTGRGGWGNKNNKGWGGGRWGGYNKDPIIKDASIHVTDDYLEVAVMEFSELENIVAKGPSEEKDLVETGTLLSHNSELDRTNPKNPKTLVCYPRRQFLSSTTSEDPVLMELAGQDAGDVYATDVILGVLMACTKAATSWDILVRKENGVIFFDKRPESKIDMLTVNENQSEQSMVPVTDKDSINHSDRLAMESTDINKNFSQQLLDANNTEEIVYGPHRYGVENGKEHASVAYRYRKLEFGQFTLVVRTSLTGYVKGTSGESLTMTARCLNEFDAKISGNLDWRQKLESQSGTLLVGEMKNNAAKMVRWMAEILLSGAQEFRLGFVSRKNNKDPTKHEILATKRYNPAAFTDQFHKKGNLWAILRRIVATVQKLDDGEYLILKDPNQAKLRIYTLPDETGEFGEEEEVSIKT